MAYSDKSCVTTEQHQCIVCGKIYDTGSLLLDKRGRDRFDRYTVTGNGLCPEDSAKQAEGYIALVGCDATKTKAGATVKLEDAYRTGSVVHMKEGAFNSFFNMDYKAEDCPMVFVEQEVIARLIANVQDSPL